MGVSLNGGTPNLHPKMIIFSGKTMENHDIFSKTCFIAPQIWTHGACALNFVLFGFINWGHKIALWYLGPGGGISHVFSREITCFFECKILNLGMFRWWFHLPLFFDIYPCLGQDEPNSTIVSYDSNGLVQPPCSWFFQLSLYGFLQVGSFIII